MDQAPPAITVTPEMARPQNFIPQIEIFGESHPETTAPTQDALVKPTDKQRFIQQLMAQQTEW